MKALDLYIEYSQPLDSSVLIRGSITVRLHNNLGPCFAQIPQFSLEVNCYFRMDLGADQRDLGTICFSLCLGSELVHHQFPINLHKKTAIDITVFFLHRYAGHLEIDPKERSKSAKFQTGIIKLLSIRYISISKSKVRFSKTIVHPIKGLILPFHSPCHLLESKEGKENIRT